jgi:2-dehydro-3-deoxy-D-pentonate aldolase
MNLRLGGIVVPVVTPFSPGEDLDVPRLREHLDFLVEKGISGVFPLGTAGEFTLLSGEERDAVIRATVDQVNGRVPVLAGVSEPGTRGVMADARRAKDLGADAAVITPPYYIKTSEEGIFLHYKTVAESLDLPIVIYNIPSTTGHLIGPGLARRLCDLDTVVGMKYTTDDLSSFIKMVLAVRDRIPVLIGSDALIYSALAVKAAGAVVGSANVFPGLTTDVFRSYVKGDEARARAAQMELMPFVDVMFSGTFPAALKEALAVLGRGVGPVRKPLVPLASPEKDALRAVVEKMSAAGAS